MPKTQVDYLKTVMYKIICNNLEIKKCYVGHTTDFRRRKNQHKSVCNSLDSKLFIYSFIRENGGWENWSMIEIEKYPCSDGNEARARERYWFEQLNAELNSLVPNRSSKESQKEYRIVNKEKLKELDSKRYQIRKQIITHCDCGGHYRYDGKPDHLKTKKHTHFLENLQKQ
jgi:hypothetical protein